MIRVLHLRDLQPEFQTERAVEHLGRDLGQGFEVLPRTIGHGGDFRHIAEAIVRLRQMKSDQIDLIHAWGPLALTAAVLAGWGKILYSPAAETRSRAIRWLNSVRSQKDIEVICHSATQHRIFVERGVPIARCHLIRPGVDFSRLRKRRNPELRAELGFAESDFILLAVGESTPASTHRMAVWAAGILNELDRKTKVLVWGQGTAAESTHRFARRLMQDGLYTAAEKRLGRKMEFEELTAVADAGLITARGPVATLPICITMAAGLPIISTVTYTVAELLEDRHTSLMVNKASPRAIAERVIDLRQDADLRWRITDNARTEAYEFFSLTRFLDQWRTAYRQAASGNPIDIPPQTGAEGSRLHGHG